MDVLAVILACSLHPDDALVRTLVDVQSNGNLLRFHFAEGLTLDGLATSYRVHRAATLARWLSRARSDLLQRTRHHLGIAVGASGDEVDSIVRALGSDLDVSLSKLR